MARRKTKRRRLALLCEAERVVRQRHGEFDLGLSDSAEEVGCSTRQLQRVFLEVGDTDFRSFLLGVRMEQAHRLLSRKKGGLTVRQAARAVGYREASGLGWQFKRFYGYPPSAIQSNTIDADYDRAWREVEKGVGSREAVTARSSLD
jgi:AraC family transcriptional regulator, regulatory protein of adaptative response / methylphosphotriester-DNA alkyltransferase methyltransferase